MYREFFGDNSNMIGNNINKYYYNNSKLLLGTIKNKELDNTQFIQYIKNNIDIYNINIQNNILDIFSKIFIYDFTKRLTVDEYLKTYLISK